MGDTQLFLVRVWRHLSQFRASVRRVDDDEPRLFTEPDRLGEYLRDSSDAPMEHSNGDGNEPQATS